jgi:CRISPR system Cascade subunit CasA
MSLNLIDDPWIPVERQSGSRAWVRPQAITDHAESGGPNGRAGDPIAALRAPRPDFDGALMQFLIGLVQTAAAPSDEREWRRGLKAPPPPEKLRSAFDEWTQVFDLHGEGPRFQQDLSGLPEAKPKPAAYLLVDSPSDNALRENKDLFVKNRSSQRYCPACTAAALQTLQVNAPQGGRGHRTSIRGGGPVSTLVLGRTLWQTVWLNVLPRSAYGGAIGDQSAVAPWLAPTRTSRDGTVTTPEDGHPLQVYWAMPRRLRLAEPVAGGPCALCGREAERRYAEYRTTSHGVNYQGPWEHPLTPHRITDDGELRPFLGQQEGFSYRYWRGLAAGRSGGSARSAQVVRAFYDRLGRAGYENLDPVFTERPRLWAFGYEASRTKMRAWHESRMPLYPVPEKVRPKVSRLSGQLIDAAMILEGLLLQALRRGLYGTPRLSSRGISWEIGDKVDGTQTFFENASVQFWQDTEAAFFDRLGDGVGALTGGATASDLDDLKIGWLGQLREEATRLFDAQTRMGRSRSADPKALGLARQELRRFSSPRASRLQRALDLPEREPA